MRQILEAEQFVLCALMLRQEAMGMVVGLLTEDDFSRANHKVIFAAMCSLSERGVAVDPIAVTRMLDTTGKRDAAGGPLYLATMADLLPVTADIAHYAEIVRKNGRRRGSLHGQRILAGGAADHLGLGGMENGVTL